MVIKLFIFCFLLIFSQVLSASDSSGLEISLSADMIYAQGLNKTSSSQEKLTMRGAELSFYSPIDHNFNGMLSAAAHDENGETNFELHELYLSSNKIIPSVDLKVGQFFLGVGRLNRFHQHDWPFIRAPKVHETFFDSEGVFDSGVELNYLIPSQHYLNLTAGVTSGYRYGHAHTAGSKPKVPTHYIRFSSFIPQTNTSGFEIAINYLGRTDEQKNQMHLPGLELTAKKKVGKKIVYLVQSESWFRKIKNSQDQTSEQVGTYLFYEKSIAIDKSLGARLDAFKDLSKTNPFTNKKINNIQYATTGQYTWRSSEFAQLRSNISHSFTRQEGQTIEKDTRFELQFVFILGSHPAHSF